MNKKFIEKWERYVPPDVDVGKQINLFSGQILLASVYGLGCFLLRYLTARSNLYYFTGGQHILRPDAVMPDFTEMTAHMFLFHVILFLILLGRIAGNYASFYRGSKSIYLMKRLPDPMERHRRCLALPLAGTAVIALTALIVLLICYTVYLLFTPAQCLTPGQWQKLWSVILCWN
ncbi:MAG: hypothetical protein SOW80_07465 [Anaerovoracaceae bacterium]|nr:hypothetical protein [Anaerovoracaceae bacterium]